MSVSAEVTDVMRQVRERVVLQVGVTTDASSAATTLDAMEIVDSTAEGDGFLVVTLKEGIEDYSSIAGELVAAGHQIRLFREEEVNLESAFMALTKGLGQNF